MSTWPRRVPDLEDVGAVQVVGEQVGKDLASLVRLPAALSKGPTLAPNGWFHDTSPPRSWVPITACA